MAKRNRGDWSDIAPDKKLVGRKALVEEHRASEHLFKSSGESAHGAEPTATQWAEHAQARAELTTRIVGARSSTSAVHEARSGKIKLSFKMVGKTPTVEAHTEDGRKVGIAEFVTEGVQKGQLRGGHVKVAEEFQRQGIASAMYDLAKKATGASVVLPSGFQSEAGKAFTSAWRGRAGQSSAAGASPEAGVETGPKGGRFVRLPGGGRKYIKD